MISAPSPRRKNCAKSGDVRHAQRNDNAGGSGAGRRAAQLRTLSAQGSKAARSGGAGFPRASMFGLAPGGAAGRGAMIKRMIKCLQATGHPPIGGPPHRPLSTSSVSTPLAQHPRRLRGSAPTGRSQDLTLTPTACSTAFLRTLAGRFTTFDPRGLDIDHADVHFPKRRNRAGYIAICPRVLPPTALYGLAMVPHDLQFARGLGRLVQRSVYCGGPPPDVDPAGEIAGTYVALPKLHGSTASCAPRAAPSRPSTSRAPPLPKSSRSTRPARSSATFAVRRLFRGLHPLSQHGSFTTIDTPGSVACGGGNIAHWVSIRRGAVSEFTTRSNLFA